MTHYERLGIPKSATQEEIKNAYKDLVKKYHPDVYRGDKSFAEKMTKEINVAYDTLSDPNKKAEYDEEINPTPSYSYTPPKYDNPPSNYNDYRNFYDRDYNYNYRYTDYHRNKTPNSSYSENSPLENKIISLFDSNKFVVMFLILIVYTAILIFAFCQFYAFKNNKYTGIITNLQKVEENENEVADETINNNTTYDSNNDFPKNYEDFNINDFISDSELYSIYSQHYYSQYENFSEFKEAFSRELYDYWYQLYY